MNSLVRLLDRTTRSLNTKYDESHIKDKQLAVIKDVEQYLHNWNILALVLK